MSSAIERTAEYEKFMKDLKAFHDQKGTLLQPEPVLGGKRLDLLKIYKIVLEAGGYEKVTLNRGWKQVGDPFHFPATCTNSAYQLKSYYTKYLLGWEEEYYWKRPWNPPAELLANNQLQQKASSPLPQQPPVQQTRQQTGTAFKSIQQQPYQPHPPMPQQQQAPFYPPAVFMDQEFRTRILLSLQSNLPNEVDWAFNTLIKFSFASENFCLDFIPTLIDLLLDFTVDFFQLHMTTAVEGDDLFCSRAQQETYERVLQVFHILRNFSFLEMNIRRLALHERLRFLLMKGIALSPASQYGELSRHCLDILENIAPQVSLVSRGDDYFTTMTQLLFSNDRAFILGAIRALTRVAVTETNERVLGFADLDVIERMAQFLMVDDEELEAATLEYLYQYSSLRGNFSTQLIKCYPGNLIGLLTGFLSYKSSLAPPSTTAIGTIHGIPAAQMISSRLNSESTPSGAGATEQPTIPDLTNYSHLDEPYRCLGWLKDQLITGGPEDIIILKDIFGDYQKLFGTEKPLGMKEFYTVLKIAFPQPPAVEEAFNSSGAPLDTVLQNVKYSPTRRRDGPVCHWNECNESFDTQVELHKHIIHQHLSNSEEPQQCQWMKCTKSNLKKGQAIHHLRTHFAYAITGANNPTKVQKKTKPKPFMVPKIPTDDSEVSGIPLTSALLLRNLARYKQHHTFYLPYESELTLLAIQRPKVSKYILTVLTELQASQ